MFSYLEKCMHFAGCSSALAVFQRRNLISVIVAFGLLFSLFMHAIAFASDVEDTILIDRPDTKMLVISSDTVAALQIAKDEAEKRKVDLRQVKRYMIVFEKDVIQVSLAPPYRGGLDGPEFRVEIRRSDLKLLSAQDGLKSP
jgi:hypothetical protein